MKEKSRYVYVLRHGETIPPEGEGRRYIGQIDIPLSPTGRKQAESLGRMFASISLGGIFSSDLSRSDETARLIARQGKNHPEVLNKIGLREILLGEWDGKLMDEIKTAFPSKYKQRGAEIDTFRPPAGESFVDLAGRVLPVFSEILRNTEGNILIIGHAGINRVIICHILGIPFKNVLLITQEYGCVNLFRLEGDCSVELINGTWVRSPGP